MKSELEINNSNEQSVKELKYPVLMKNVNYDYVVLFTGEKEGVIVYSNEDMCVLGRNNDCWISANNTEHWEKLDPEYTIKLSNDKL